MWLGVLGVVAGCAQPPGAGLPAASASATAIGFRCAPPGTVQTFQAGEVLTWRGADPERPDVCVARNRAGSTVELVRGLFQLGSVRPDSIPAVREAMAKLTTRPPGTLVEFVLTGNAVATATGSALGTWTHVWQVTGQDSLRVGAVDRPVWSIEVTEKQGPFVVARRRYSIDQATGIRLRQSDRVVRTGAVRVSDTTSLVIPGGP